VGEPAHEYGGSLNRTFAPLPGVQGAHSHAACPLSGHPGRERSGAVILEHIDYLLRMQGERSPFAGRLLRIAGGGAFVEVGGRPAEAGGVGETAELVVLEILERGSHPTMNNCWR